MVKVKWFLPVFTSQLKPVHNNPDDNDISVINDSYRDRDIDWLRRTLDKRRYGLEFSPVTVQDSGTYFCFINNRLDSSPVELIVQDAPEPPPHRPMISSISSRWARTIFQTRLGVDKVKPKGWFKYSWFTYEHWWTWWTSRGGPLCYT